MSESFQLPTGECRFLHFCSVIGDWRKSSVQLTPLTDLGDTLREATHQCAGQLDARLRLDGKQAVADEIARLRNEAIRVLNAAWREPWHNDVVTLVPASLECVNGPDVVNTRIFELSEYLRFTADAISGHDDPNIVTTCLGTRWPRDEFTEEARRSGEWALLYDVHPDTFRSYRHDKRVCEFPRQKYIIHLDDLPKDLRSSKVHRDQQLQKCKAEQ